MLDNNTGGGSGGTGGSPSERGSNWGGTGGGENGDGDVDSVHHAHVQHKHHALALMDELQVTPLVLSYTRPPWLVYPVICLTLCKPFIVISNPFIRLSIRPHQHNHLIHHYHHHHHPPLSASTSCK